MTTTLLYKLNLCMKLLKKIFFKNVVLINTFKTINASQSAIILKIYLGEKIKF